MIMEIRQRAKQLHRDLILGSNEDIYNKSDKVSQKYLWWKSANTSERGN